MGDTWTAEPACSGYMTEPGISYTMIPAGPLIVNSFIRNGQKIVLWPVGYADLWQWQAENELSVVL